MSLLGAYLSWAVPPFALKQRHTWSSLSLFLLPLPFLLLQLHLLVRYDPHRTAPVRIALIVPIALLSLPAAFARYFDLNGLGQVAGQAQGFNFAAGVFSATMMMKACEWGFQLKRPRLKRARLGAAPSTKKRHSNDEAAGEQTRASSGSGHKKGNGDGPDAAEREQERLPVFFPGTRMPLELDLLTNLRGIGWEDGEPLSVASVPVPRYTYRDRLRWAASRLPDLLYTGLLLDALLGAMQDARLFPQAATLPGTGLWDAPRGLLGPAGPYLLALVVGTLAYTAIQSQQIVLSLVLVLVFHDLPSRWDPLPFTAPFSATSLQDLWSRRWHHLFRQPFRSVGFDPLYTLVRPLCGRTAARAAGILGVFALSAFLHDWGQSTMLPVPQTHLISQTGAFFLLQGVAIILEQLWSAATGRRVSGMYGWMWTFGFLTLSGTLPTEEWMKRGLGTSRFFVPSFTRPLVTRLIDAAVAAFT